MEVILASPELTDIRVIDDYNVFDADCGDTNDFELRVDIDDYEPDLTYGNILYVPGTECGGIIGEIESDTSLDEVAIRGYTWRGYLQKKIIIPTGDYKKVSGDLSEVIDEILSEVFDGIFYADPNPTGITVTNYQFERYTTVLDGFEKLLKEHGYRLHLTYGSGGVKVSAVPIVDHSHEIELSQDSQLNFKICRSKRGITTLICLGKGELSDRTVVYLYAWPDGSIQTEKYYTGIEELQEIYDYTSAEDRATLVDKGTERFMELMSSDSFEMDVEELGIQVEIGDVIGGRDYVTEIYIKQPVKSIAWRVEDGIPSLTYSLEGNE